MAPSPRSTSPILAAMLGAMSVARLAATVEGLAAVRPRRHTRARAQLIEMLLTDAVMTVARLAPLMRYDELQRACKVCGLSERANRAQVLERRLVAADTELSRPA